jgi:two-component system, OmpR family, phosphate regulon sensor histidine kinase PhoR
VADANKSHEQDSMNIGESVDVSRKREDFMLSLTHDLKAPLLGSNRMLDAMIQGLVEPDDIPKICKRLKESNNTLLRMIWNTLELFRSESGQLAPVFEPLALSELVQASFDEFNYLAGERHIALVSEVPESIVIKTDRFLLRRVLVNLLDNALKNTPPGGTITLRTRVIKEALHLDVVDTGVGISEQLSSRLFERFSSGQDSRSSGGTGTGLYLCKQLCAALGGTIECTQSSSDGSQFTIKLPVKTR